MDNQKDITIYKGQSISIKDMSFIKNRLEKLAMAVFMVTDYIDSTESLRTNLRKLVLDMVSKGQENFYGLSDMIDEALSFIKIGGSVNLISETSSQILVSEFEKLKGGLAKTDMPDTFTLKFMLEELPPPIPARPAGGLPLSKGEVPKAEGVTTLPDVGRPEKQLRPYRQKIIDFIGEKGSVSIKDIAVVITDCSEKTIQRELASLVDQNVLHRIGQKRWARYLLVAI